MKKQIIRKPLYKKAKKASSGKVYEYAHFVLPRRLFDLLPSNAEFLIDYNTDKPYEFKVTIQSAFDENGSLMKEYKDKTL